MLKEKTRKYLRIVAVMLIMALSIQSVSAVAESVYEYNNTYHWLIEDTLTATTYSEDLFNKYKDNSFESNTSEIISYNEFGEMDYTYALSGSVGDATATLNLCYWDNTADLGNAPYAAVISDGAEAFVSAENGTNFMDSVYGFGTGWSLDIPQIEYVNETAAYLHTGEGKAYRIGAVEPTEEDGEVTYKLCGFPYDYTLEKYITCSGEEDTTGSLNGFVGTDRYGNKYYFNLDGRFVKSEDKNGTVQITVTYDENKQISSYCAEDYTLNFNRTFTDLSTDIKIEMVSSYEDTNEDGETVTVTGNEIIYTISVAENKLISIYEGDKNAEPEVVTEVDETNNVTVTTTDSIKNSVSFEYEEEKLAILLNSESSTVDSNISGEDVLLLKKVTVYSESSTVESYIATDEADETAVNYAAVQNDTALNETEISEEIYTFDYCKAYTDFGLQSSKRFTQVSKITHINSKINRDTTKEENTGYSLFEYDENSNVVKYDYNDESRSYNEENIVDKLSNTTDTLLYNYTTDEDANKNITVLYRHYYEEGEVELSEETVISDDYTVSELLSESEDYIEFPFNLKSSITKNQKGEVIYYRSNDGAEYYYTYNDKGDVEQRQFDNYTANYDADGNLTCFKVGDTVLNNYQYDCVADPSLVTAVSYANGDIVNNEYDENGNLIRIYTADFGTCYSFEYDEEGIVTSVTDHINNRKTEYVDTVIEETDEETQEIVEENTEATDTTESETEDIESGEPLTKRTANVYDISNETSVLMYSYDVDGESKNITLDSVSLSFALSTEETLDQDEKTVNITTSSATLGEDIWQAKNGTNENDLLESASVIFGEEIPYLRNFSYDSSKRVSSETAVFDSNNISLNYTYDDNNNIIEISDGTQTTTYEYDSLNQLTRANDPFENKTYLYSYDNRGNILSKEEYDYTTEEDLSAYTPVNVDNYTYSSDEEWKDKLLTFDGNPITYDESGNPLTYNGYTYTWEMGRQLKSVSNGTNTYTYAYNQDGIRTSKTVNGVITDYVIDNKLIKAEYTDNYSIVYWYDDNDSIIGFFYTDKTLETPETQAYIYTKNIQGDITGILDSTGAQIVAYTYDAWGNVLSITGTASSTIGTINPIRYRGYYLDNETGYYYLQSRYYNPEWHRFINADDVNYLGITQTKVSLNAFVYCENNPVIRIDKSGLVIETVFDVVSIIWSLWDLITAPSWANVGYLLWDIASIIPYVPGSYVAKGGKICIKVANKISDFAKGSDFITGSYKKLKKLYKGVKNIEIHHLVEKRFKKLFKGINVNEYLSIPLDKELHKVITNRWRNLYKKGKKFKNFKYGSNYTLITKSQMEAAIREVYKDMPQLLDETLKWFKRCWKK